MPVWTKIDHGASDTTPLLSDSVTGTSDFESSTIFHRRPKEARQSPDGGPEEEAALSADGDGPAWSDPLGRPSRTDSDEHLVMFRRAVGINSDLSPHTGGGYGEQQQQGATLEQGRRAAVGIYRDVLRQERQKGRLHHALAGVVWACHGAQVVLGATLTCLGIGAGEHATAITVLGAANTVVAGLLALVKGKSLPERLGRAEADFRQLKVWIEETEALLALGIIGGDRREVGALVQTAYRRFNACSGRSFDMEADVDRAFDNLDVGSGGQDADAYP